MMGRPLKHMDHTSDNRPSAASPIDFEISMEAMNLNGVGLFYGPLVGIWYTKGMY